MIGLAWTQYLLVRLVSTVNGRFRGRIADGTRFRFALTQASAKTANSDCP
jgi:hypothetical protein